MTETTDRERRRRPRLFSFRRRRADPTETETEQTGPDHGAHTPQQLRLRLAEFEQGRVADVMIPRAEIVGVELSTDLPTLIQLYAEESHSRLPVYRETLDDPIGLVHIKDVVGEVARGGEGIDRPLERLRRDILFVPASMKLADLLVKMQSSRIHMALVVDEYGGTDGLVSLEDLMEEIVGDIGAPHGAQAILDEFEGFGYWNTDLGIGEEAVFGAQSFYCAHYPLLHSRPQAVRNFTVGQDRDSARPLLAVSRNNAEPVGPIRKNCCRDKPDGAHDHDRLGLVHFHHRLQSAYEVDPR